MIFTKKQSKEFIDQVFKKEQLKTAVEGFMKDLTMTLHIPISIVNSGSKRVYESLMNDHEFHPSLTLTTQSIQVDLGSVTIDPKQNTGPSYTMIILKSSGIPHKFTIVSNTRTLITKVNCRMLVSNQLEALQMTEYLIDNLSFQRTYMFTSLGIQYSASYSLESQDFDANINKNFAYENDPNELGIDFSIDLEITYHAFRSANLIQYIKDHTIDPNKPDPIKPDPEDPDDNTGGVVTPEPGDGNKIVNYLGTVATAEPYNDGTNEYYLSGGMWYNSPGVTDEQINKHVRVRDIKIANSATKTPKKTTKK